PSNCLPMAQALLEEMVKKLCTTRSTASQFLLPQEDRTVETWWQGVAEDFGGVCSLAQALRIAVRLVVAAFLGGVLGYDRQRLGKSAGLRTHMLVSLGAAFFILVPEQAGMTTSDLSRVMQGVITGIGFLGGGAILKESQQGQIKGLTTAAGLWLTTAVGIAAGLGRE